MVFNRNKGYFLADFKIGPHPIKGDNCSKHMKMPDKVEKLKKKKVPFLGPYSGVFFYGTISFLF